MDAKTLKGICRVDNSYHLPCAMTSVWRTLANLTANTMSKTIDYVYFYKTYWFMASINLNEILRRILLKRSFYS